VAQDDERQQSGRCHGLQKHQSCTTQNSPHRTLQSPRSRLLNPLVKQTRPAASAPSVDFIDGLAPGGATCLLLASGAYGMLRADDAERLQVGLARARLRSRYLTV
jgi:hypothetical protein